MISPKVTKVTRFSTFLIIWALRQCRRAFSGFRTMYTFRPWQSLTHKARGARGAETAGATADIPASTCCRTCGSLLGFPEAAPAHSMLQFLPVLITIVTLNPISGAKLVTASLVWKVMQVSAQVGKIFLSRRVERVFFPKTLQTLVVTLVKHRK